MSDPTVTVASLSLNQANEDERALFDRKLRGFVPPDVFDAHAHLYVGEDSTRKSEGHSIFDFNAFARDTGLWMGDRAPKAGLFFGLPRAKQDTESDNALIAGELNMHPQSRGLLLVRPADDPDKIAKRVEVEGWSGFKVYHLYAARSDTFNASMSEFLPDWVWQIADRKGLVIMYHMVRNGALADPNNQREIRDACLRYPNAKLILAHAARGFCADHTIEGIDSVADLDNLYFDTSAIAEVGALIAILQRTGTHRLMFGTDYPISQLRGRNLSLGDGFFWMYDNNADYTNWTLGKPVLNGIECLLALQQAARLCHLRDDDLEHIFADNARQLLGLAATPTGEITQQRYTFAKSIIPGGTQLLSKRPELQAPDAWPAYYQQAKGIEIIDLDGRRFKDFSVCGIGSTLLGFSDPDVDAAVAHRVMLGAMCTLNPPDEIELAKLLTSIHPWAQQVRFTRCGGEAMAVAVRIARAATGRSRVAFCGYHGWADWYIAANLTSGDGDALSGHLLPGLEPAGVPRELAGTALPFAYNKPEQLEAVVAKHGHDLAAIVMEPTRYTDPNPGFLESIRATADRLGAALIFDEITIGWRLTCGGAHLHYGIHPDIAVFSKATGNGYPVAAILGVERVMSACHQSFISSTMWTEGIGPAAAMATIHKMQRHDVPRHIAGIGEQYRQGIEQLANQHQIPLRVGGRCCLTTIGFDHPEATAMLTLFTRLMLERGYLAGGGFYPTLAHQPRHVDEFLAAAAEVFKIIKDAIDSGDILERIEGKVKHTGFARLT